MSKLLSLDNISILSVLLILCIPVASKAQSTCTDPMVITSIPFSSGTQTTCGMGNDYLPGSYAYYYGLGEDYVFKLNVTSAPITYIFSFAGDASLYSGRIDVNTSCAPTSVTSIGTINPGTSIFTFETTGTYYLYVDNFFDCFSFTLNIDPAPPPPINDNCMDAIALTVNEDTLCDNITTATTAGATFSLETYPTCGSFGAYDDDVWFKFTATDTTHRISLLNTAGSNMVMALYSGLCGSLYMVQCSTYDNMTVSGLLTVGSEYYIRVWTNGTTSYADFDICVGAPLPPPPNDNISGALTLTPNSGFSCGIVTSATTRNATPSVPTPSCNPLGANDDVWFVFTATHEVHKIDLMNVSPGYFPLSMVVYKSDATTAVEGGACTYAATTMYLSELTVGSTYYVRVWTASADPLQSATFDICLGTAPPPPSNDNRPGAMVLKVNPDYSCYFFSTATTASATASTPSTSCNPEGANDDVWFRFKATNEEHRITLSDFTPYAYMDMVVYESDGISEIPGGGACASYVTTKNLTGLIVGNTYYVRVWTNVSSPSTYATFDICVGTPPPPPSNDACMYAKNIPDGMVLSGEYTLFAGEEISPNECGMITSSTANDVWYSVTAMEEGDMTVTVLRETGSPVLEAFSGTCDGLSYIECSFEGSGNPTITLPVLPGETYYYRVFNFSYGWDEGLTFDITAQIDVPLDIVLGEVSAHNIGISNIIEWHTLGESGYDWFEIERSIDARSFEKIGDQKSVGIPSEYSYLDQYPGRGINYYRLAMLNKQNEKVYSKIVSAEQKNVGSKLSIFPNPTHKEIIVKIENKASNASIVISELLGKIVKRVEVIPGDEVVISLAELPQGVYFLKYEDDLGQTIYRVIKY